jgi:glycerol-3-phosphate dehydrogenase
MFDPYWRLRALSALDQRFDLLVIGGGISGCGIFLDAAQRGLRVLLVERCDVASGTSSRSSKLIHGGLRYLKRMHFRITRTACRERDRLLALNPHLVSAVPFLYPAYEGDRTPGWKVDLGLWMYDRLTHRPEKHSRLQDEDVARVAPGLQLEELDRALRYSDAMADDARLTAAVAATGVAYGGEMLTRVEVLGGVKDGKGRFCGALIRDLENGTTHRVDASVLLNATGHWVDRVREVFGLSGSRVRPSRGVHVVLQPDAISLDNGAVAMASPADGRPVFLVSHPEGLLLGTTDHFHVGSLDDPRATVEEVSYLLEALQAAFPSRLVDSSQIVGTFAGIRPIIDMDADEPTEASREEAIWEEEGLVSVAGGKLTTYRSTAEDVVDRVLKLLPEERVRRLSPCATWGTPLAGLCRGDLASVLVAAKDVDPEAAEGMARRLGSASWLAVNLARRRRDLWPLMPGIDLCTAEVRAHLHHGAVLRLEDLLLRRVRLGMWNPPLARDLADRLRPLFSEVLGWRRKRWQEERDAFELALRSWAPEGVQ